MHRCVHGHSQTKHAFALCAKGQQQQQHDDQEDKDDDDCWYGHSSYGNWMAKGWPPHATALIATRQNGIEIGG